MESVQHEVRDPSFGHKEAACDRLSLPLVLALQSGLGADYFQAGCAAGV